MKVSVSLPAEDVAFLDAYAQTHGIESHSAVVQKAVRMLRVSELGDAYEEAFSSWADEGEAYVWDEVTADDLAN